MRERERERERASDDHRRAPNINLYSWRCRRVSCTHRSSSPTSMSTVDIVIVVAVAHVAVVYRQSLPPLLSPPSPRCLSSRQLRACVRTYVRTHIPYIRMCVCTLVRFEVLLCRANVTPDSRQTPKSYGTLDETGKKRVGVRVNERDRERDRKRKSERVTSGRCKEGEK